MAEEEIKKKKLVVLFAILGFILPFFSAYAFRQSYLNWSIVISIIAVVFSIIALIKARNIPDTNALKILAVTALIEALLTIYIFSGLGFVML